MYDSDRDSLCVAWKRRWGPGGTLRLVFIHIPSSGSDNVIAGEKRPGPPPWALAEAQEAALLPWTEEMLPRSPRFAAWRPRSCSLHRGPRTHAESVLSLRDVGGVFPPRSRPTGFHSHRPGFGCSARELPLPGRLRKSGPARHWGGRRSQRSLGWMDRPQQWGLGTVQGEGMSWLLDVVLSCFLSPPACLCDVSLQESLMFSDPEYSRGRRLGRRRVSSSFFPTFFYKMWQLGLL